MNKSKKTNNKKIPKKTKTKIKEENIQLCNQIRIKKINNVMYGRECSDIVVGDGKCKKCRTNKKTEYEKFWPWLCESELPRGPRKGIKCNDWCKEGEKYCNIHIKNSHTKKQDRILRTFKIRFYPSCEQIKLLKTFFGCSRKTYNLFLDFFVKNNVHLDQISNKKEELIKQFSKEYVSNLDDTELKYLIKAPKSTRQASAHELIKNCENTQTMYEVKLEREKARVEYLKKQNKKVKKKKIKKPLMKHVRKKDSQSIQIDHQSFKFKKTENNFYISLLPKYFKNNNDIRLQNRSVKKNKTMNRLIKTNTLFNHDIKVIHTLSNKYYFCISYEAQDQQKQKILNEKKVCAIDPGVRTAFTVYSPSGEIDEIGVNCSNKYFKLRQKIYKLKEKYRSKEKLSYDEFNKIKIARNNIEDKICNSTTDLHYKSIKYLTEKYDTIILPKFNSKSLMQKKDVHVEVKRSMQALSHSKFRWKLITKAILSGTCVIVPTDEYKTTMTCHKCFNEYKVEKSKTYECTVCDKKWDRDINAAINILIRQVKLE